MIPIPDRPKQVHPQAVAICAGILLIGVWMSWYNLSGVWRARNWDSWREVKGKVIEGSVRGGRKSRNISCDYAYTVNGELYTNNVVTLMSSEGHQGGGVTAGAAVTVYYDPAEPAEFGAGAGKPAEFLAVGDRRAGRAGVRRDPRSRLALPGPAADRSSAPKIRTIRVSLSERPAALEARGTGRSSDEEWASCYVCGRSARTARTSSVDSAAVSLRITGPRA